jgi:uncharacterized membrane protein YhdT
MNVTAKLWVELVLWVIATIIILILLDQSPDGFNNFPRWQNVTWVNWGCLFFAIHGVEKTWRKL